MHELSIIQNVISAVCDIARDEELLSVERVVLLIGRLRQVVKDPMEFAYEIATKDTIAEGSELVMEFVPIRMRCNGCIKEFVVEDRTYICPECESYDLKMIEGDELLIKSIVGEKEDGN